MVAHLYPFVGHLLEAVQSNLSALMDSAQRGAQFPPAPIAPHINMMPREGLNDPGFSHVRMNKKILCLFGIARLAS